MASLNLIGLWVFLFVLVAAVHADAPRYYILDAVEVDNSLFVRVLRDDKYDSAASGGSYGKGHVEPVSTFIKSDPKANLRWGSRHRVGAQYAGR